MLNKEKEYWKPIPEFEGLYMCSTLGNIKRVERYVKNRNGYRKLTEKEVLDIMNYKLNGLHIKYVYEKYKDKISYKGLEQVWYRYNWKDI